MRRSLLLSLLVAVFVGRPGPLAGQATSDRARLALGIGIGYRGGAKLWSQGGQQIEAPASVPDTAVIAREVAPQIGLTFTGTYFPSDHFGFTAEADLLGLKYEDSCHLTSNSGSIPNGLICKGIQGAIHGGTAVTMSLGALYRLSPKAFLSPYLRANVGVTISQESSVETIGTWVDPSDPNQEEQEYFVFGDPNPASMTPALAVGGGFTALAGAGSQLRLEFRDNIIFLNRVTSAVAIPVQRPATVRRAAHLFALTLSYEVVLERRRGRRY
ncbi:MAG: hypothetical protein ACHQXA_02170 [Gemmatimonadales bacterium]